MMNNQAEENKKQRDAMNQGENRHPSSSNFKNDPQRAREAGRKGGSK